MKTLQDIQHLAETASDKELNIAVFEAIQSGELPIAVFLEYQEITQIDVADALLEGQADE